MCPSRMLNCTHHHIIIRVKKFSDLLASLGYTEFQPHFEWKNHEACILLLLLARSGGNHEVCIHILLSAADGQTRYPITVISLLASLLS